MQKKLKIIIIGGGFAGIQLAKNLDDKLFDILLIDKINYHQFQPLLYQVATSQLEPSSISFPLRSIFKNKQHVQIRLAEVIKIDTLSNRTHTTIGDFVYDYLVLAIGCKTNFFGNTALSKHSLTLKSTYDAIEIRNHVLQVFEDIISAKEAERESLQNLVIVGAGPTGVELAGAFAEIKKNVLPYDYHGIDFSKFKIIVVEGSKNTLNNMSTNAKNASRNYLTQLGVNIITEVFVKNYDGNILELSNGNLIKTKTVIWSAGVTSNSIEGLAAVNYANGGRIKVDRINKVVDSKNIFAIGDIAYMETPKFPNAHPQLANVAINQAKNLAKNLKKLEQEKETKEYEYKDLGVMVTIGKNKAVVDFPYFQFKGYFAWLIWMFLHLMLILSVRNKLIILINWAWAYIKNSSSLSLILKPNR